MKQIQGKQGLVRGIGSFGKPMVREIGIPLYKSGTKIPCSHSQVIFKMPYSKCRLCLKDLEVMKPASGKP